MPKRMNKHWSRSSRSDCSETIDFDPRFADIAFAGSRGSGCGVLRRLCSDLFPCRELYLGIYPRKKKELKQEKQESREPRKSLPDVTKDEVLDAVGVAVRSVKKLKFHLHRLKLHFISAFPDPYQTAMVYGYASAAVNAFALPTLKQSDIQLGVDFERESCYADGYLTVTIKLYYIMKLLCCLVWGILPILWRRHRRVKAKENSVAVKGKVA